MDKYQELINIFSDILKQSKDYHIAYIYSVGYVSLVGSVIESGHVKSIMIDEVFSAPERLAESLLCNWRWQWFYENRKFLKEKDYDDIRTLDNDVPAALKEQYFQRLQELQQKIQKVLQARD